MEPVSRRLLVGILLASFPAQGGPVRADWMGAYLNRAKVGFSLLVQGQAGSFSEDYFEGFDLVLRRKAQAGVALYSEADLEFQAFGAKNRVGWRSIVFLDADFSLSAFGFLLSGGGTSTRIEGERVGNSVSLTIGEGAAGRSQSLSVPEGPLFVPEALPLVFAARLREGRAPEGEYPVLEPHQLTVTNWRVNHEGRETLETPQGPVVCHRVRQDAGGFFPVVWIDDQGIVWKEYAPLGEEVGYYSYRETETQARDRNYLNPQILVEAREDPSGKTPDLLYSTAIDAGTRIVRPSQVKRMVVDLWDLELRPDFPFSDRQKSLGLDSRNLYTQDFPLRLEINALTPPVRSSRLPSHHSFQERYSPFLAEETFIEANHPKILELAAEVTENAKSPWEKALALFQWIQRNIETEFRITLPSALEVLESKKGDCNEQSALLAALCRAAGVPAKICTGLVYQGGAFYYHAWNEVLVQVEPELWVPIDPAMRQEIADATHIKFSEGGLANQTYINGLIGRLKANIREIELHDSNPAAR